MTISLVDLAVFAVIRREKIETFEDVCERFEGIFACD